jgi:hypothetical protein
LESEETQVKDSIKAKTLTNWQAVGIGAITGFVFMLLFFVYMVYLPYSEDPYHSLRHTFWNDVSFAMFVSMYLLWPAIVFGIAGAMAGKSLKKTWRAAWIGALLGSLPVTVLLVYVIFHYCIGFC